MCVRFNLSLVSWGNAGLRGRVVSFSVFCSILFLAAHESERTLSVFSTEYTISPAIQITFNHLKLTLCSGFEEEEDPSSRSFFSEIISSISDVKFSHDGRYILSRDYLSLKIWDVNMESKPVKTIPIHDHLRGKLCDLYENDCIFDKFECVWGGDDK